VNGTIFGCFRYKDEEELKAEENKKRVPLSLEELVAKKKADDEAQSKVGHLFTM